MSKPINVTIVGGGMFTCDVLLPSVYQLQRMGVVNELAICALNSAALRELKENEEINQAFPEQGFTAYPPLSEPPDANSPNLFKEVIAAMPPRQAVAIALPDQLHYQGVMTALSHNQHVLCVKPLVLTYENAIEVEKTAREKGLFVGIEYHKRFDNRSLLARKHYRGGDFGEFVMGEAKMIEPYFYRHSNFQNWFTCENTDPFTYVGCHYVDLVYFITGLRPVEVSVAGVKGKFPNGKEGYMWANGRVIYENGAILSVTDGLGYPDDGAGSNEQCLEMFCEGNDRTGMIKHDDQYRGVTHSYLEGIGCAGSRHNFVSPDFFKYVPYDGPGFKPVGYGFESVAGIIGTAHAIENEAGDCLERRRELIAEVDERGMIATPANSWVNELVMEAARMSILSNGDAARIIYGNKPHVELGHAQIERSN